MAEELEGNERGTAENEDHAAEPATPARLLSFATRADSEELEAAVGFWSALALKVAVCLFKTFWIPTEKDREEVHGGVDAAEAIMNKLMPSLPILEDELRRSYTGPDDLALRALAAMMELDSSAHSPSTSKHHRTWLKDPKWCRLILACFTRLVVPWLEAAELPLDEQPRPPGDTVFEAWVEAIHYASESDNDVIDNDITTTSRPPMSADPQGSKREIVMRNVEWLNLAVRRAEVSELYADGRDPADQAYIKHTVRRRLADALKAAGRPHEATRQLELLMKEDEDRKRAGKSMALGPGDLKNWGCPEYFTASAELLAATNEYMDGRWRSALPRLVSVLERLKSYEFSEDIGVYMNARFTASSCQGLVDLGNAGAIPSRKELVLLLKRVNVAEKLHDAMVTGMSPPAVVLKGFMSCLTEFEKVFGAESLALLQLVDHTMFVLLKAGRYPEGITMARRFLRIADLPGSHLGAYDRAKHHDAIGMALEAMDRDLDSAAEHRRIAGNMFREALSPWNPRAALTLSAASKALAGGMASLSGKSSTKEKLKRKVPLSPAALSCVQEAIDAADTCLEPLPNSFVNSQGLPIPSMWFEDSPQFASAAERESLVAKGRLEVMWERATLTSLLAERLVVNAASDEKKNEVRLLLEKAMAYHRALPQEIKATHPESAIWLNTLDTHLKKLKRSDNGTVPRGKGPSR